MFYRPWYCVFKIGAVSVQFVHVLCNSVQDCRLNCEVRDVRICVVRLCIRIVLL